MASSFKFHSSVPEIVPWQAQYQYPSQSNKVRKQTVKLVPKNGSTFSQNLITRFELPADGYCNMLNTSLSFDVTTTLNAFTIGADDGSHHTALSALPFLSLPRGGAHNYIKRLRIMYGSLVLEDIQEYKTLVRILTEVGVNTSYQAASGSILEGHSTGSMRPAQNPFQVLGDNNGISTTDLTSDDNTNPISTLNTVASQQIGGRIGISVAGASAGTGYPASTSAAQSCQPLFIDQGTTGGVTTNQSVTRTFNIQLLSGLLTSKKLLPLKWMASQLAIEITWAPTIEAICTNMATLPTISFGNLNLITELLEFDSSYDLAFFEGLNQPTGVPLKFSSWHYHQFGVGGTNLTYQIHERSRSVKAAFAVIRQLTSSATVDADMFFHNLNDRINPVTSVTPTSGTAVSLGYYVSPETSSSTGTGAYGSGFIRGTVIVNASLTNTSLSTNTTVLNSLAPIQQYQWRIGGQYYPAQPVRVAGSLGQNSINALTRGEEAYAELMKAIKALGDPIVSGGINFWNYTITGTNGYNGEGSKFIMANSFETPGLGSDSINGINAEEQSDLALYIQSNQGGSIITTSDGAKKLEVFVNYDNLLLIRSGNVVDLVL